MTFSRRDFIKTAGLSVGALSLSGWVPVSYTHLTLPTSDLV